MTFTRHLYKHEDNAAGQLNAGISAVTTSIPLKAGEGAEFPQPITASATSGGTSTTLNSTGIQAAGVIAGDVIINLTDGSSAVVKSVTTNAAVTTRLKGGSGNTWDNADVWVVRPFVITMIQYDTDGTTILKREKALIKARSTDTLTAHTRGWDGDAAQSFLADDYVYQFWTAGASDGLIEALGQISDDIDGLVSITGTEIYAADAEASDTYVVTLVPAPIALTTGMRIYFKPNTANTGAATLNANGLGAKTIKKNHDQDLATGDLESGQMVLVVYDGTNWQMMSQLGSSFATQTEVQNGGLIYAADGGGTDAYAITLTPAPGSLTTGMVVNFKANTANTGTASLNVNSLGSKTIKKHYNKLLVTDDILANQIVTVIYDGTDFQMLSSTAPIMEPFMLRATEIVDANFNGTITATGFEDIAIPTLSMNTFSTNSSIIDFEYSPSLVPYFYQASNYTGATSGGCLKIGSSFWRSEGATIYKDSSTVTISGTVPAGDASLGYDSVNGYLLVQDSSTTVKRYSGIAGTTITYVDTITLDNASDTGKGFIYDNTNNRFIFIDGTDIRRFTSAGATIDTISMGSVTPRNLLGLCFVKDRIYTICAYPQDAGLSSSDTSLFITFNPTTMLR